MDGPYNLLVLFFAMYSIIRKKTIQPRTGEVLDALFSRLIEQPNKPQSKRVERVLELLSSLGNPRSKEKTIWAVTSLREALRIYQWVSQVMPTADGFRVVSFPVDRSALSADDKWEYEAVRDLLDLTLEDGSLSRLRRCDERACKTWFYAANRMDQRFCNGTCRQRHYDSDEEKRIQKRAYMRKRYADTKERELNPKRFARK